MIQKKKETTKELATKAGAVDFIEKPFGIQTLLQKIHKHLQV
jgi:FixJ family two-component response regulator